MFVLQHWIIEWTLFTIVTTCENKIIIIIVIYIKIVLQLKHQGYGGGAQTQIRVHFVFVSYWKKWMNCTLSLQFDSLTLIFFNPTEQEANERKAQKKNVITFHALNSQASRFTVTAQCYNLCLVVLKNFFLFRFTRR